MIQLSPSEIHSLLSALIFLSTKEQIAIEKLNGVSLTILYNKLVDYVNDTDVPVGQVAQ